MNWLVLQSRPDSSGSTGPAHWSAVRVAVGGSWASVTDKAIGRLALEWRLGHVPLITHMVIADALTGYKASPIQGGRNLSLLLG